MCVPLCPQRRHGNRCQGRKSNANLQKPAQNNGNRFGQILANSQKHCSVIRPLAQRFPVDSFCKCGTSAIRFNRPPGRESSSRRLLNLAKWRQDSTWDQFNAYNAVLL